VFQNALYAGAAAGMECKSDEDDSAHGRPEVTREPTPPSPAQIDAPPRTSRLSVEDLYRQHWRDLCRRLRRIHGDGPPEPEDLAQAAFEKFATLEDHDRIQHPRAFLFRIAVNLGLNAVERIRVARRFVERELVEADEAVLEENSPEDVYSARERLAVVERAMEQLTMKQKEILVRSRFRGETYAQIGQATGWSQADISRQLNAALAALQRAIADAEGSKLGRR